MTTVPKPAIVKTRSMGRWGRPFIRPAGCRGQGVLQSDEQFRQTQRPSRRCTVSEGSRRGMYAAMLHGRPLRSRPSHSASTRSLLVKATTP